MRGQLYSAALLVVDRANTCLPRSSFKDTYSKKLNTMFCSPNSSVPESASPLQCVSCEYQKDLILTLHIQCDLATFEK